MKIQKTIIFFSILLSSLISISWANSVSNLKDRLDKCRSFHAIFIQKIIDNRGNIIQEGRGNLWVKRPALFKWHTTHPDESIIVSDGKVLWMYNPLIDQVTVSCLKDIINSTPLALIVYDQFNDWENYHIKQYDDTFILTPKNRKKSLDQIAIQVNSSGKIHQFSFFDKNNQKNIYNFTFQKNSEIDVSNFVFIPPKGVSIDNKFSFYD